MRNIDTVERSVIEVIMHSSPFAMLLLLASTVLTCVFVIRTFVGRSSDDTARALTDAMLFISVVAFITFLLLHNTAQAVFGLTIRGIDADRPVAVAVENIFVYASIGSVMVGLMLLTRLVKRR